MEFKFSVNDIFKKPFVEINHNLIPPGFTGDRRSFWDIVGKVSEVVNAMGEASAAAQGLTKPITTAERLRNSEHTVYLLIDSNAGNGKGAVTGMLKTGKKGLYVFDRNGHHYQVSPPCVLDFYIHESRQRTGLGKRLFEHMLQSESIEPVKMAIDRPSDKFLGFLNKHYTLNNPVKQMNNYVVFDGFFPSTPEKNGTVEQNNSGGTPGKKQSANGLQTTSFAAPLGRYGAPRPHCSMGQIIHNQTSTIPNTEPTGTRSAPVVNHNNNMSEQNPGNPINVTQSAPNTYYRSQQNTQVPETDHYHDNSHAVNDPNNLQYYQQHNNPWQGNERADNLDPNKTNFNQHAISGYHAPDVVYNPTQNYNLPENVPAHSGDNAYQQPRQMVDRQEQVMYQNATPSQYPAMMEPNMVQNYMVPNPVPAQGQLLPNMQQYPLQYAAQGAQPSGGEQVQAAQNITHAPQRTTLPYVQPVAQTPQMQPQETPVITDQQTNAEFNQQKYLQNEQQYVQNAQNIPRSSNYLSVDVQNQQMLAQNNQQNNVQTRAYDNQQMMIPQQNLSVPALYNANTLPYNAPIVSQHEMQPYSGNPQPNITQSLPQANVPPSYTSQITMNSPQNMPYDMTNVTPSLPNTNVPPQYTNQMIPNHPQNIAYDRMKQPNVTPSLPSTNMYPQYNQMAVNQQNVTPSEIGMRSQYNNQNLASQQYQPQNILPRLSQTALPQHNANQGTGNREAQPRYSQTVVNQQNTPPQAQQSVHQNVTARRQTASSQTNVITNQNNENPAIQRHMEGSQLANNHNAEEMQALNAKGDMQNVAETDDSDVMFKYGYPPQVPDPDTQVMEEKVSSSPKLERPRSLSIQLSEEQTEDKNGDVESEVPAQEPEIEEEIIEKLAISENDAVIENEETPGNKTPGKKTPSHLTEQGFLDLKFYHNKLW